MSVSAHTRDEVARVTSPVTDDNELSGSSPTLASDLSAPESHVCLLYTSDAADE